MAARYDHTEAGEHRPAAGAISLPARLRRAPRASRAPLAIAVALVVCLAMPVAKSLAGQRLRGAPTVFVARRSLTLRAALSRLPPAARGPVSAALGRIDPLYRAAGPRAAKPAKPFGAGLPASAMAVSSSDGYSYIPQGPALTPSGEEGAGLFGYSVALSADGDTALIGGPGDDEERGAAWIFTRFDGVWTQLGPKLTGGSEEIGKGFFGSSVALSADGSTALIGAEGDNEERGAAWVFIRHGSTWTQDTKLIGSGESGKGLFGASVALVPEGNLALVGGPYDNEGIGAAWSFKLDLYVEAWAYLGKFTSNNEIGKGLFGTSVALVARSAVVATAVIGAPGDSQGVGAVWVGECSYTSPCSMESKLVGNEAVGRAEMGASVALVRNGNETVLVGGPGDRNGQGSVWVFGRSMGAWGQQGPKLEVAGTEEFGTSVALSNGGDMAIISGIRESGVWEFLRGASVWTNNGELISGSAEVAASAPANTLLLGADATDGDVGFAGVLVYAPESEPESRSTYTPPPSAPGEPTNVKAMPGDGQATVSFTPPPDNGPPIISYTVRSYPATGMESLNGVEVSGSSSPITVKGLTNATPYRFEVRATNAVGKGPWSESSERVIPLSPAGGVFVLGSQKAGRGGTLALSVYVSGPGVVSARQPTVAAKTSAKGARAASARGKPRRRVVGQPALVRAARASARRAGVVTLLLKPTRSALRALRAHRRVKAPLLVAFVPAGGAASSQQTTVELGGRGHPAGFAATAPPQPGERYFFASGLDGWESAWGDLTLANSASERFSGAPSLQVTIHSNPLSAVNATYKSSSTALYPLKLGSVIYMWVYRPASTPSSVAVVPMVREGPGWTYCPGAPVTPPANTWYELSMTVANCTGTATASELEIDAVGVQIDDPGGAGDGRSVYLDQVSW